MASILSNNSFQTQQPMQMQTPQQGNPMDNVNSIINQIMGSQNPTAAFQQMVGSSPEAQSAMNLVNQYGNGDPKAAFMNYAAAQGKQALAQQIMQKMGLA